VNKEKRFNFKNEAGAANAPQSIPKTWRRPTIHVSVLTELGARGKTTAETGAEGHGHQRPTL